MAVPSEIGRLVRVGGEGWEEGDRGWGACRGRSGLGAEDAAKVWIESWRGFGELEGDGGVA